MKLDRESYVYRVLILVFYVGSIVMPSVKKSNWNEDYHCNSSFQYEAGKKAIDALNLKGDEKVLDVGSGTGKTSYYCAQRLTTGSVHGVDYSQAMLNFAHQEYGHISNLTFSYGDAADISFEDEFDIVCSFFCLQWVKQQQKAMGNIVRSLKKGGRGLIYVSCGNELSDNWYRAYNFVLDNHPEFRSFTAESFVIQSPDTWSKWTEDAGASGVTYRMIDRTKVFVTPQEMKSFLLALDIEPKMTQEQREQFLDLIIAKFYQIYNLTLDDSFEYTTATMVLEFQK